METQTEKPKRIQRKRERGWRMPEGAISVTRPGKWGNPFRVGHHYKRDVPGGISHLNLRFIYLEAYEGHQDETYTTIRTAAEAVEWFEWYHTVCGARRLEELRTELRGKDLACWCPLQDKDGNPVPCHADILLKLSNQ